jgi:hypothetical protein
MYNFPIIYLAFKKTEIIERIMISLQETFDYEKKLNFKKDFSECLDNKNHEK